MTNHRNLVVVLDGERIESPPARDRAFLLKAIALLGERITFARQNADGSLTPVPDEEVDLDCGLVALQNIAAAPDSVRGVVAAVASVVEARQQSARRRVASKG